MWFCAPLAVSGSVMLTVLRFGAVDMFPWHPVKHFFGFMNVFLRLLLICYFYDDRFDIIYILKIVDCDRGWLYRQCTSSLIALCNQPWSCYFDWGTT